MRESQDMFKKSTQGRRISRLLSQGETSMMESMSNPGTTASLKDCFDKVNEVDENRLVKEIDRHQQRSQSLEDDLKAIRDAGDKLMRSSTQGFQLLWARAKFDAVSVGRNSTGYDERGRDATDFLSRSVEGDDRHSPLF